MYMLLCEQHVYSFSTLPLCNIYMCRSMQVLSRLSQDGSISRFLKVCTQYAKITESTYIRIYVHLDCAYHTIVH